MVQVPAGRLDALCGESAEEIRRHRQSRFRIGEDAGALWNALRDVMLFWIDQGVKIFRVDNPHTKPFPFWEWLIREVQLRHPDVIFLAEAFTRPKLMKGLAKLGFTQSYTYFTWRTQKWELEQYLSELTALSRARISIGRISSSTRPTSCPIICRAASPGCSSRASRWPRHCPATTASTTDSSCWSMSRFRAAKNISIPRNTRSRCGTGTSPATSSPTSRDLNRARRDNPALQQTSNLRFLGDRRRRVDRLRQGVGRSRPTPSSVAIALSRDVHEFWLPLGDVQVGAGGDRRHVAAVENLDHRRTLPHRMGRHPVADRSRPRSRAAVPLPGVRAHAMKFCLPIDTNEAERCRDRG